MPDNTLKQAIKEAYASAPANVTIIHTLELNHPNFKNEEGDVIPLRIVKDYSKFRGTLEKDAPFNPGEEVLFTPLGFQLSIPPVNTNPVPEIELSIDNVSLKLLAQVESAIDSTRQIEVIYRPFLNTDTSEPQIDPPIKLFLSDVQATLTSLSGRARMVDIGNRTFPKRTIERKKFPTL